MVIHYKCQNCGSNMTYDITSGKLHCTSCGRDDNIKNMPMPEIPEGGEVEEPEITPYLASEIYEEISDEYKNNDTAESQVRENENNIQRLLNEYEMKAYHCKNCGAQVITDQDTTATTCSFCGAATVLFDRLSGEYAPAKVIPFKVSKQEAQQAFVSWCKKGRITPKGFMSADRIKSITGIYIPFWLYDVNAKGDADAICTKVRSYTRGDYIYTETSYYHVYRRVELNYKKVPADASEKMVDKLMDKLEPFHYDDLVDFNMPYLAGYLAEKYNYNDKQLFPRIKQRIEPYVDNYVDNTITGYTTKRYNRKSSEIKQRNAYYTLLPIWMVCYDYKDSEHIFAMNGQTGKIVGKPPLSKGKIATWFAGVTFVCFAIMQIVTMFI